MRHARPIALLALVTAVTSAPARAEQSDFGAAGAGPADSGAAGAGPADAGAGGAGRADGGTTSDDLEARRLYDEGRAFFDRRDYERAIERLEASYRRVPAPILLYNLGQAHRLRGSCAQALSFYRRFLDVAPDARARERTLARVAEAEQCAAAPSPSGGDRAPDGDIAAAGDGDDRTPPARIAASPAPAAGRATATATAGAAPAATARAPRRARAGIATGIGALALASASGYFAWSSASAADEVTGSFQPGPWSASARDAESSGLRDGSLALAAGIAAAIAAGIAAWLLARR